MATIQGGPLTTRPGDYNQRSFTPIMPARNWRENSAHVGWALTALGQTALDGPILVPASRRLGRNRAESGELRR
jgi:hypothetical protein